MKNALALTIAAVVVLWRAGSRGGGPDVLDLRAPALGAAVMFLTLSTVHIGVRGAAPITDGHLEAELAPGISAWVAGTYPELGWIETGGLWARPGAPREFVLISERPLQELAVNLRSLVDNDVSVQLGSNRIRFALPAGPHVTHRLPAGPGRHHPYGFAYRLVVEAAVGTTPAQVAGGPRLSRPWGEPHRG